MATTAIAGTSTEMTLSVRYQGYRVETGRMSAVELGPAIFGLGEAVAESSRLAYGDETRLRIDVQANMQRGSFMVDFVAVSLGTGLLTPLTLSQIADVCGLLGLNVRDTVMGVFGFARRQNGRQIESADQIGDSTVIKFNGDNNTITLNTLEYRIYTDSTIRKGLKALVEPLRDEGVDEITVRTGNEPPRRITREEYEAIADAPLPEEEIGVNRSQAVLEIVTPQLRPRLRWRFASGGGTFTALVKDEDFIRRVERRSDLFGAGDALLAELEIRTTRIAGQLRFQHTVLRVIEHIPGDRGGGQLSLPGT